MLHFRVFFAQTCWSCLCDCVSVIFSVIISNHILPFAHTLLIMQKVVDTNNSKKVKIENGETDAVLLFSPVLECRVNVDAK